MQPDVSSITSWRYGEIAYLTSDLYIGRALEMYGEWAQQEIDFLLSLLAERTNPIVVDVGANIGTHSLAITSVLGSHATVYALEPQSTVYDVLVFNTTIAKLPNIKVLHVAAGPFVGTGKIPPIDYNSPGNFGGISMNTEDGDSKWETVEIITLDSLSIPRCDLLKIDAEGMESGIIEGAKSFIRKHLPMILAECSSVSSGWDTICAIQSLSDKPYSVYLNSTVAFNANNFKSCTNNIFGDMVETSLVFYPKNLKMSNDIKKPLIPVHSLRDLEMALLNKTYVNMNSHQDVVMELKWCRSKIQSQEFDYMALQTFLEGKVDELKSVMNHLEELQLSLESSQQRENLLNFAFSDCKSQFEAEKELASQTQRKLSQVANELEQLRLDCDCLKKQHEILMQDNVILKRKLKGALLLTEQRLMELTNVQYIVEKLRHEYDELSVIKNEVAEMLNSVLNSRSWRLTAPFRALKRIFLGEND